MPDGRPLPYVLEDRTGCITASDYDDIYDRLFFRVARSPQRTSGATMIYDMGIRASRRRDSLPLKRDPIVVLEFGPDESLGTLSFVRPPVKVEIPMARYLRRASLFGGSLTRKFTGSDGREYKWSFRSVPGQEWTCASVAENFLVAHYDLKPLDVRAYGVSGNNLTIYEPFVHLAVELLTSLTIMRHIAQFNL